MLLASPAAAGPYFRFSPLTEIRSGAFFKPTASEDEISVGFVSPLIYHDKDDGYLLIPGVDWDLLDIGWILPTESWRGTAVFGPSINMEEPVKTIMRKGIRYLPGGRAAGSYGALRRILAPAGDGERAFLALGPAFGLETASRLKQFKGHFIMSATLNKRF